MKKKTTFGLLLAFSAFCALAQNEAQMLPGTYSLGTSQAAPHIDITQGQNKVSWYFKTTDQQMCNVSLVLTYYGGKTGGSIKFSGNNVTIPGTYSQNTINGTVISIATPIDFKTLFSNNRDCMNKDFKIDENTGKYKLLGGT